MVKNPILVVGSGLRDIYINLDSRANAFEFDDAGTPWLDLGFNEQTYTYFQQTPVVSGAGVTLEVLGRLGHAAELASGELELADGRVRVRRGAELGTRFILCHEQKTAYLTPRQRLETAWRAPAHAVDWVFVDRSAELTEALVAQIERFLDLSRGTSLKLYLRPQAGPLAYRLAARADLVFVEAATDAATVADLPQHPEVCQILPDRLVWGDAEIEWHPAKVGFLTHLTLNSVVAATLLALSGEAAPADAALSDLSLAERQLLLAKLNAENARLDGTLSRRELEQMLADFAETRINTRQIAASMVAPGKGILAADESGGSTEKHFAEFDIVDDEQHRRDYRNLLLSLPDLPDYVNAVILFDETTHQLADDGQNFVDFLTSRGIIPGVKVDAGLENFPDSPEKFTRGLEGLPERMRAYFAQGLRFAKWRSLFEIDRAAGTPSDWAIERVCADLARYARICQIEGIVPIVEPEVLHDGDHTLAEAAAVQERVLTELFRQLRAAKVDLPSCILKCSMVLAGSQAETSAPDEVGRATAEVLRATVPEELAGVVFLSGGQSVEQATENLRAVTAQGPFPWPVTFSFARALQWPALEAWRGDNANIEAAQAAYRVRLQANCAALVKQS